MAESVVVNARPPVIGVGEPARLVASAIAGRLGPAARLGLLVVGGSGAGPRADEAQRADALRAADEADGIPHFTVELAIDAVWVGPAVVPGNPGCHRCWEARRRQHARALAEAGLGAPAPDELMRLAVRAGLAVARRVLTAPDDEAAVVRRFGRGGGPPVGGRVAPVTGCERCDPRGRALGGWSPVAGDAPGGWSLAARDAPGGRSLAAGDAPGPGLGRPGLVFPGAQQPVGVPGGAPPPE